MDSAGGAEAPKAPPLNPPLSFGTSVLIQGVECGFVNVPLHNIYLSSDLVTGLVAIGIRPFTF